ncbi:hypothetical protein GIB67_027065 [Kingdonia uniflora]|uniref:non-specific serine/threonine protein kinase n=1 Tax=Kingdonia uniflora TaxID=39325 RepID=A0A7J7P214_9MAGN|nr:hypothetical protein GIB67_027065 [Kingdonia uniflora]
MVTQYQHMFLTFSWVLVGLSCFIASSGSAAKLVSSEVKALKEIGSKLGKKDWDFRDDPCSGIGNWTSPRPIKGFDNSVACDCVNSTCHVVSMYCPLPLYYHHHLLLRSLQAQNLSGTLPPELSELRFLKILDLSRNFLSGSVPQKWSTLHLTEIQLMANRLSGPFPKVLTSITTLTNLSMEGNRFSGTIPPELGNLVNLRKLVISSNQFTGELPNTLAKLTKLTDTRMSDNNFSGRIPDFIRNWTSIEKLVILGSSFEGPIPTGISELTTLSDLRISDLKGRGSEFPLLSRLNPMRTLILRNCLIHGNIPEYVGDMMKLKNLDLSFNNLTGEVPASFTKLTKTDFISLCFVSYLTGNQLTGAIPGWILERNKPVAKVHPCLKKNFPCDAPKNRRSSSLHINCGGREIVAEGIKYEEDVQTRGASLFYPGQNWALSSTGDFVDNDVDSDVYTERNTSTITNVSVLNSELYTTARISPLALTYYGLCLLNGNYTVKLHFAEIIYTNDGSFNSLGKRIFDVYVQGKLVLKDFNIVDEAGGTNTPIVRNFTAVVASNTLVIHFYWAGKGTTGIPTRGTYGPLVSAISVNPNFKPPSLSGKKISVALVVGISASVIILILMVLYILWRRGCLGGKVARYRDLRSLDLRTGSFTLRQIKAATKNFNVANKLGEGGFGSVYKGLLSDGTIVAVKQLSSKSKQGSREFVNEIGMISALQHPNLVKLYGCCVEGNQLLLVYEYMENNCLSRALFGRDLTCRLKLDWPTRQKICLGIARGLAYLHEESRLKIVHRDIKGSNVLLDKDLNAKISDFGLAKLNEDGHTHISTRVAGTIGYMAPEYAMRGYLTDKADVYSFGVCALEIVSGKSNTTHTVKEDIVYLLDWAYVLQERGSLLELVDPNLGLEFPIEEAMVMLNVALLCTSASPTLRPTMTQVVNMLEGRTLVQDLLSDPGFSAIDSRKKTLQKHFWQTESQTGSSSTNGCEIDSSVSNVDKEETGSLIRHDSLGPTR